MTRPDKHTLAQTVVSFGRMLKEHGFAVSPPTIMDALEGLSRVGIENPHVFKTVLKATFMTRLEETAAFERLFHEFWLTRGILDQEQAQEDAHHAGEAPGEEPTAVTEAGSLAEAGVSPSQEEEAWLSRPYVIYSPEEVLRKTDFRDIPEGHDYRLARLIREIVAPLVRRAAVRRRPASSGVALDFRKLLRRSAGHGGEILELPRLKPKIRIKKIVFLCDVSGSMNPYLAFILQFIKELQHVPTRVETFVFATRLSRITPLLMHLPFKRALDEIATSVLDWSGGTRIGSCLQDFTTTYGGEMLRPSTVILIHSDGWDRGDPELLAKEMSRIQRRAYRVIWINPLLGGPAYEPTCRGMKAALPFIHSFLPGHTIAALERLAGTLRGLL